MTTNSWDDKRLGGFDAEVQILKYVFFTILIIFCLYTTLEE